MRTSTRRWRGLVPAALTALALTGCWPVPGGNAGRSAHNPFETAFTTATVAGLEQAWLADLGTTATGQIVAGHGGVYARLGPAVSRVDLADGVPAWTWTPPDDVAEFGAVSDPLVVDGAVHIGYGFGNLGGRWFGAALDPASGEPAPGPTASGLLRTARGSLVLGQVVSFGSGTPVLHGYRITDLTGATGGGGPVSLLDSGSTSLDRFTLGSETTYHAGTGLLVDAAGALTQGAGVRAFARTAESACGPPTAEIFLCPSWTTPLAGVSTDVVIGPGERTLYVGRSDGSVVALDAADGDVLWSADVGSAVRGTPALAGGVLYVPTDGGDLVAVDAAGCGAATCAPLWSAAVDGTALAQQPAVAGDGDDAVVFVGTQGGTLAAVAAAGCGVPSCDERLWQVDVGAAVTGAPAVTGGHVIVGTGAGQVAAFRPPAS